METNTIKLIATISIGIYGTLSLMLLCSEGPEGEPTYANLIGLIMIIIPVVLWKIAENRQKATDHH